MSIETTLTLIAAGAILVVAGLVAVVASALGRGAAWAWRSARGTPKGRHLLDDAIPRAPLYARVAEGTRALALYLAAAIAQPFRSVVRDRHLLLTPVGPVPVPTEGRRRHR